MRLALFQEMMELNQAFDRVLRGLKRMEGGHLFQRDIICYARAEVESARVDANREFFDAFEEIVENDARWAYRFQGDYDRKATDVEDLYLEIKEREMRKKKGLPPRLTILPNWVPHDEERHDEARRTASRRRSKRSRKSAQRPGRDGVSHRIQSKPVSPRLRTAEGES